MLFHLHPISLSGSVWYYDSKSMTNYDKLTIRESARRSSINNLQNSRTNIYLKILIVELNCNCQPGFAVTKVRED